MPDNVKYLDKSYSQKRKILRSFSFLSNESHEIVNMLLFKIMKKIKSNGFVNKQDIIYSLLVDGYISYEKKYDNNNNLISLVPIDVINVNPEMNDGEIVYLINKGKTNSRILTKDQIIYVISPTDSYISIVEMVYLKVLNRNDKYSIKYYINNLIQCYNENFLNLK